MTIHPVVQRMLETERSAARLGVVVDDADAGVAVVRQVVEPDMANGLDVAQGGFVFALADQAFACAVNTVLADTATVDAAISYISPAFVGDELRAVATIAYVDERRVVARARREYGRIEGLPVGVAEQHPDTWMEALRGCVAELLAHSEVARERIAALGVAGQQHGLVALDGEAASCVPRSCGATPRRARKRWNSPSDSDAPFPWATRRPSCSG